MADKPIPLPNPHSAPRSKKPLGAPTRGKTAPNRLRRTDVYLALCHADFLDHLPGLYIDLGFGENPITTLETAARLRRLNPRLHIVGVEIDPERVAAALPLAEPGVEFRRGGFNLPLREGERAAVIRAMNVLRQYPHSDYARSVSSLAAHLVDQGILLEGTSDPEGRLMVFNIFSRQGKDLSYQGLVFSVKFRLPFSPRDLQAVLPKNHIHNVDPGSSLDRFFGDWDRCWQRARPQARSDPHRCFSLSASSLSTQYGYPVDLRPALLRRGYLRLRSIPE